MDSAGDPKRIVVERATASEQHFVEVCEMLIELHREGGYAPLNCDDAAADIYQVLREDMTFIARQELQPVGVLGLTQTAFWYNRQAGFLMNRWFYVRPDFRHGQVGIALLRAARAEGQARNQIVFVSVTTPDRRPKRSRTTLDAQIAGFVPLGYTLMLTNGPVEMPDG
jgi:GNAT superfamily N-acetyltransferase